ncbi:AMP-dependent synthetase [Rhodococcus sp. 06-462-5]|uniref:class I adenylate-forming enzyme family protein n=1 Tax=Nocardiaceae TaxID=85025 RepID=UPI00050CAE4F|nr:MULTISPECIES: AMP-binding protein [Rhodococcus]OZC73970.1 AMP-dependent synthetase [Rhodococcus sp. 06-462-5]OZE67966.1 AMP-dependent synthetase [Rhodococcus sp. 02-925g]OZF52013.1 AMP-dependent synthetase [Rhodococcus sp. 14-1411-2a]
MEFGYLPWVLAEQYSDSVAIADERQELTFSEVARRCGSIAAQLAASDVTRDDVVAVMLPNRLELVLVIGAAWRLGAAVTPINPALTAVEAAHQLADSGARLVVTVDGVSPVEGVTGLSVDALDQMSEAVEPPVTLNPDTPALIVYTSGSTGRPRGVVLSHANAEFMSSTFAAHFELTASDHCLLVLPLFHVNALMVSTLAPLRVGGRMTIVGTFSKTRFFGDVERVRPTYFSGVPTIFALLAALPADKEPDVSSLRFVVCGAAPISRELLAAVHSRYGFEVLEGYGLTEGTCASTCNPLQGVRKLGTVGPALPGQTIRVVGPHGMDVATDSPGEVLIQGPAVMQGYLGNPSATAETVRNGWLHTGDIGALDGDGYLRIVDRVKDMIIRGGENIYPKEIEQALTELAEVLEAAVVGVPDPVLGEVPVAQVVLYPNSDLTVDLLLAHCAERLTRVKIPTEISIVESLPKNAVGKTDKPGLRRMVKLA